MRITPEWTHPHLVNGRSSHPLKLIRKIKKGEKCLEYLEKDMRFHFSLGLVIDVVYWRNNSLLNH